MALKMHRTLAVHPGTWLKEEMVVPYGVTITDLAERFGVSRPPLSNLLNGKAGLSPDMAIRFEKAFGVSAATLLRMQASYDLARAEQMAGSIKVDRIPEPV